MMRMLWQLMLCSLVVGFASRVAADDGDPLAMPRSAPALAHFDAGAAAFEARDYDRAIAEYEAGAPLEDLPAWDWNLGLAHQRAGNLDRARWYFDRFISRVERMADAGNYIAAARLHIDEIDAAQVKQNRQQDEERQTDERVALRPPSSFTTTRKIAVGVGVGALVVGGVGVALTLRAQGLKDDAAAICPTMECSRAEEANRLAGEANTNRDRALVAYGVGVAAIVGAVVLWFVGEPEHAPGVSTVAVPRVSPTYAGIDVTMRF